MEINRREFLALATGGLAAAGWLSHQMARSGAPPRFKAIAFDAFPVFDPRPVARLAEALFPGKGAELTGAWRTRQFEYQWLRTLSGHYANFWRTTEDALTFATRQLGLEPTRSQRAQLLRSALELQAWPDAPSALRTLKEAGVRLAFVSNMTMPMLETGIESAGLTGLFEHVLSSDRIRAHKPDPRAYRSAAEAFGLERGEILFAAFAGWDAAGAKWAGYPTYWVNRLDAPHEELGVAPDAIGRDLDDLVSFVMSPR